MSLTFTARDDIPRGLPVVWKLVDVTMDTDYPDGGWAITAANVGLRGIIAVIPLGQEDGFIPCWDRSAGKLKMFEDNYDLGANGPLDQCAVGEDALASKIVTCLVVGW